MTYLFQVVKAKYPRPLRHFFFFLLCISIGIFFATFSANSFYVGSQINFFFTLITLFIIVNLINAYVIDRVRVIGAFEMDDKKIYIRTDEVNKTIYLKDVDLIKLRVGTGSSKSPKISATMIVAIVFNEIEVLNVHITREYFKDGKKQRQFFWNKNVDFFNLLENNNIKFEFDNSIKEKDCIKN